RPGRAGTPRGDVARLRALSRRPAANCGGMRESGGAAPPAARRRSAMPQNSPTGAARRAQDSPAVRALARTGYAASGVLHLLVGWLAVQLTLGRSSGQADESGA